MMDIPQRGDPLNFEERKLFDEHPDDFVDNDDERENVVTYQVGKELDVHDLEDQHEDQLDDQLKDDLEEHLEGDLENYPGDETDDSHDGNHADNLGDNLGDNNKNSNEDGMGENLENYQRDYTEDYNEENHEDDLVDDLEHDPEHDLEDDIEDDVEDDHEHDLEDDHEHDLKDDLGDDLRDNPEEIARDDPVEKIKNDIQMYPSLKEMKKSVVDGSFDWSKTARSILFLKKHKCASSTLREALRNYLYWRGMTEEKSIFQALGGCYPSRWDPKCRPPIENKYHVRNILYHHRLNLDEQLPLMFPDTKLITTVREPVSLLYRNFFFLSGRSL